MAQQNRLVLGISFFVISGHREGWRLAEADNDRESLDYYRDLAREAEAAGLQFMFLGDSLDGAARITRGWTPSLEPQVLAAALAAETRTLGFIPSTSSIYHDPFTLARSLASLDHLSDGRIGWNILTSFYKNTARDNYTTGRAFAYEDRYEISQDFVDALNRLWSAWEPDAVLRDRDGGHYVDAAKVHPITHEGPHFALSGALNVSRSPQERPVFFVPTVSDGGQDFSARNADVVFTSQPTLEEAKAFYRALKARTQEAGRAPAELLITPGAIVVVGADDAAAWADLARLRPFIDEATALRELEDLLGYAPGTVAPGAGAADLPPTADTPRARGLLAAARRHGLSFLDLAYYAASSRGFPLFVGSAATVADDLELWFREGGADGFVLGPVVAPDGFTPIYRDLVPELQRRGLFRDASRPGETLREALGLPTPRFSS